MSMKQKQEGTGVPECRRLQRLIWSILRDGETHASNPKTIAAWTTETPTKAQVHGELGLYILLVSWPPPAVSGLSA